MEILHIGHASFAIRSGGGAMILIDPFFAGGFTWEGAWEEHLDRPAISLAEVENCAGILVTHDHGDHYDPAAVRDLRRHTGCALVGPPEICTDPAVGDNEFGPLLPVGPGDLLRLADLSVKVYSDIGEDGRPGLDRRTYLVTADGQSVFHGGDSHGPGEDWPRLDDPVSLALLWPYVPEIDALLDGLRPQHVAIMHYDRFRPGNFSCNADPGAAALAIAGRHPRCRVHVLPRGRWIDPTSLGARR